MPIVQIEMFKGRTIEQKRELAKRMTEVICETTNCPADAVNIVIKEMEKENYSHAGILQCDR